MNKNTYKNNKGFSLVELIIVIAIMAILAAAVAPALLRYIVKARKADDIAAASTIADAVNAAISDDDEIYEYISWHATQCPSGGYRVLCWSAAATGSGSRYQCSFSNRNGMGNERRNNASAALIDNLNEVIGDKITAMKFESFSNLDQWIVAVDEDCNIYVFESANFRANSYNISADLKGGSPASYCYEVWPEVDPKYHALQNAKHAQD